MPGLTVFARRTEPSRIEIMLLGALMFSVPLLEAPKHLLWLAWLLVWLASRGPGAFFAPRWSAREWIVAAFAVAVLGAGLFTDAWTKSLQGAGDGLRLALTLFLIARGGYRVRQLLVVLGCALAGTLVALAWAVVELLRARGHAFLELNSVGHVNHTAIYLAITTSVAIGLAVAAWRRDRRLGAVLAASALLLGVSLFVAASRAALGAMVVSVVLFAWAAPLRTADAGARRRFRMALAGALLGAMLGYGAVQRFSPQPLQPAGEGLSEKFESRPAAAGFLAFRDRLWRVAILAFASNPAFGIGNNQFRTLTPERLCPAGAANPPRAVSVDFLPDLCDTSRLYFAPHAHSLYANTLAERGAFGLVATGGVLVLWAWALVVGLRFCRTDDASVGLWFASLGGWCVTALAGLLNTTLQHEHGLLAVVLLGGLLVLVPPRGATAPGAAVS